MTDAMMMNGNVFEFKGFLLLQRRFADDDVIDDGQREIVGAASTSSIGIAKSSIAGLCTSIVQHRQPRAITSPSSTGHFNPYAKITSLRLPKSLESR